VSATSDPTASQQVGEQEASVSEEMPAAAKAIEKAVTAGASSMDRPLQVERS
jgi:hypothetical protein